MSEVSQHRAEPVLPRRSLGPIAKDSAANLLQRLVLPLRAPRRCRWSTTRTSCYAWEEALGWEQRPPTGDEDLDADDREDFWYLQVPGFLEANPLGIVPTLS